MSHPRARGPARSVDSRSPTHPSCARRCSVRCATRAHYSPDGRSRHIAPAISWPTIRPTRRAASRSIFPCDMARTRSTSSPTVRSARSASSTAPTACWPSCFRPTGSSTGSRRGNVQRRPSRAGPRRMSISATVRRGVGRFRAGSISSGGTRFRTACIRTHRSLAIPAIPGRCRANSSDRVSSVARCATSRPSTCVSRAITRTSRATPPPCYSSPAAATSGL